MNSFCDVDLVNFELALACNLVSWTNPARDDEHLHRDYLWRANNDRMKARV